MYKLRKAEESYQLGIDGCKKALGHDDESTLSRMRDLCNLRKELKASQAPMGGGGNAISPKAVPPPDSLVTQNPRMEEASLSSSGGDDHYSERRHERRKMSRKRKPNRRRSRNDDTQVGTSLKPAEQR
jgi:hypothetical protein